MTRSAALGRRWRQSRRVLAERGVRGLVARTVRRVADRLPSDVVPEVRTSDVLAADIEGGRVLRLLGPPPGPTDPLAVNWVMTPPAPGSGGHGTAFRLIRSLEERGHRCRIYLYDVYGTDARYFGPVLRDRYPGLRAEILDVDAGIADAHATFATSWPTAYPVFNATNRGVPCYLVQDLETWFHAVSTERALAENTYRMGFKALTAGRWLAERLAHDFGTDAVPFDFGCDLATYRLLPGVERNGVAFYAKPDVARRAYRMGMLALTVFRDTHPDVPIHVYGDHIEDPPFPVVQHGVVTPAALNDIYNRCLAGLTLSLTNVSLVPHEMLAAGCVPVVNDAHHNRVVLDNDQVDYAPLEPHALAAALARLVDAPRDGREARVAAAVRSVRGMSWDDAGQVAEDALRRWVA